jgi:HlyD family secretion protein
LRIDKFLKNSRIIKRRTVAKDACEQGRIFLNDKPVKPGAEVNVRIPALGKETHKCRVTRVQAMASYATWRATKTNGQYDVKSFDVKMVPEEKIEDLRPGMTAIVEQ